MTKTSINWPIDQTWHVTTGCTPISPGCKNCYALKRILPRMKIPTEPHEHPDLLREPLSWKKPSMAFVSSEGDLFHPDISDHFLLQVFTGIAIYREHTFLVLTKRPDRMRKFINETFKPVFSEDMWPLKNLWLGVSAENQQYLDLRMEHLTHTDAYMRFLSLEPLLWEIDLRKWLARMPDVSLVIVGGESGSKARYFNPDWGRKAIEQCHSVDPPVDVFMKQLGTVWVRNQAKMLAPEEDSPDFKGEIMYFWPEDLRVREWPEATPNMML